MIKYNVNFINQNRIVEVEEGTLLSAVCEMAGYPLDLVCNGRGTCGKCKVTIELNGEKSEVLSCKTCVNSEIKIYINEENYNHKANILETSLNNDGETEINPSVTKKYIDIKTIKNNIEEYLNNCDLYVLKKFSYLIYEKDCKGITYIKYNDQVLDVQLNDTTDILYGAAVDIGTTTVVAYIYNLNTGKLLKTYSQLNKQISGGADVISRINYADNKANLKELNDKILLTINKMLEKAEIELPHFKENIYNITLCGNSTMQHLFLNLRPDSLGESPFTSVTKGKVECFSNDLNINCNERCKIIFLPLLGGFVGADTLSVLLTINEDSKKRLIIDLGTNGEIAIGNINKYYVASTACGPALEGGNIECGMRGTAGAIEKFKINNNTVELKVIGDVNPRGICGSGIIDIVAELLKESIIDNTGKLLTQEEFSMINLDSPLGERLVNINGINSFIIYKDSENENYLTQKDIRQIQLAKSSIYSGCMSLLKVYGCELHELDEILMAGAFGNYIDIGNAVKIGLIPDLPNKIKSIGNGAGKGVSMYLINEDMKNKCDKIVTNTIHFELANDENFAEGFIKNMNF